MCVCVVMCHGCDAVMYGYNVDAIVCGGTNQPLGTAVEWVLLAAMVPWQRVARPALPLDRLVDRSRPTLQRYTRVPPERTVESCAS